MSDGICEFVCIVPEAVPPTRNNTSDSGYDLTLIGVEKQIGDVTLFKTGIKVKPPIGYYFDLVPRSSIIKTGYMLANNVGIIDADYTGEILVPLINIDKSSHFLPLNENLPIRLVQLIPRKWHDFEFKKVDSLSITDRAEKGFGSSGN